MTARKTRPGRPQWLTDLEAKRAANGVCRHCGGRLPCWSEHGDHAPGLKHTRKTWDAMHKAAP